MQQERKFDKNTLIGFALIAVLMAAFFYINQPSEEELKERQQQEQLEAQKQQEAETAQVQNTQADLPLQVQQDSTGTVVAAKDHSVENDKIKATFSGKGGYISELLLKEFSAFDSAAKDH